MIDPIARYRWFRDADQAGQLLHYFRQADVRELENITGVARTDADLEWAHQNVPRSNQTMAKCGYHIHYTRFNKDGVSVQKGKPFYDYKPKTFPVLAEYGGVCGAISTVNTDVRRAFGVPSFTVGQPGHCAYITKKKPDEWCIGNNIFGWTKSTHADRFEPWGSSGDYMRIYRDITRDIDALRRAELLITTADATSDNTAKRACLDAAIDLVPRHFGAWEKLAALHPDDVDALKVRAAQVFDDFATPDSDLIKEFDNSGQPRISRFRPRKRK